MDKLHGSRHYLFGVYSLSDSDRFLLRDGQTVPVTPKVLATLAVLVHASGEVVSKQDLLAQIWPDSFVEEGNLTQNISVLRKLMARDYPNGSAIETISRFGYRFRPDVRVAYDEPSANREPVVTDSTPVDLTGGRHAPSTGPASPEKTQTWHIQGRFAKLRNVLLMPKISSAAGLLGLILVVTGLFIAAHRSKVAAISVRTIHPRIAVMAFTNLSQLPDAAWLASALRETLATDLGSDINLRVISNENVERAERELRLPERWTERELSRLCDNLDCDQVITGTYLLSGGKVRLDARLVDARSGATLGKYTFTREEGDLLSLINETGAAIRANLGSQEASAEDLHRLQAGVSANPLAYRLYVEGLEHTRRYDGRAAMGPLTQAIQLDPSFSLAHHALSEAYLMLGFDAKAISEARIAESLSRLLSRREQLEIAASARNTERKYLDASVAYATLSSMFPSDLNYVRLRSSELCLAGRPQQGLDLLHGVTAPDVTETHEPKMYLVASDCYALMGDWVSSQAAAKAGADESQRRGAKVVYDRLLTSEAQAMLYNRQLDRALAITQEALSVAREFGDFSGEMRALNRQGQIFTAKNDLPAAQKVLEEALTLEERYGGTRRQIVTLSALGLNLQKQGNQGKQRSCFNEGSPWHKTLASQGFWQRPS